MTTNTLLQPLLGRGEKNAWSAYLVVIGLFVVASSAVSLGSYSGAGVPPIFGDFEAQRHWMEVTQHLSPGKWYFYDLQWWGLDYPPLTAYHSWACGKIGSWIDPTWFALESSRGLESPGLKAYMRQTVLASEILFFLPFIWNITHSQASLFQLSTLDSIWAFAGLLLQPSLIIIDNGHFQYNSVMLGLFAGSVYFVGNQKLSCAAFLFTLALMFKQMALYYSPIIFFVILGRTTSLKQLRITNFSALAGVVLTLVITTTLCMLPFLSAEQASQVVFRVFPFARGLWEDKVANLWCTLNTAVKLKLLFEGTELQKLALLTTVIGIMPACIKSYLKPTQRVLPWAFASSAWAFYLFSFQVHEKSVLLPLLPTTMLLFEPSSDVHAMVIWINNIAYYSMWPLLNRDGLVWQYLVLLLMWNYLVGMPKSSRGHLNNFAIGSSYAAIACLAMAQYSSLLPQLNRYPDIWVVLNCTLSFGCFAYFYLWQVINLLRL